MSIFWVSGVGCRDSEGDGLRESVGLLVMRMCLEVGRWFLVVG